MNSPPPYDLVIGLDRSDAKADLHLIDTRTRRRRSQTVDTSPEALREWLLELRQQHLQARVAVCLEQPAVHLLPFLESYAWITLYPINPLTLQKFREAFVTSRAKDDAQDAYFLAQLLLTHPDQLKPWAPEDSPTRAIQQLVAHRRTVVDERTGLTNRLQGLLKQYFPRELQQYSGVAPVTKKSGRTCYISPSLSKRLRWQRLRRGVTDLWRRGQVSQAANRRYLEALASVTGKTPLRQEALSVSRPCTADRRRYRPLNPWARGGSWVHPMVRINLKMPFSPGDRRSRS